MARDVRMMVQIAVLAASVFAAPAMAQSVEEVAAQLAVPAEPCEIRRRDGSCAVQPESRQLKLGGGAAKAAQAVLRPVRADINMSFLLGSAELTAQARATLDRFAASLVKIGSYRPFVVEGHTDRSGTRELNMALSAARAQSVVNYLVGKGVDPSRLSAQGYGYDRPLAGRSPDDAANRRVEVAAR